MHILTFGVEGKFGAGGVVAGVGFGEGDDEIDEIPDVDCAGAEEDFGDADGGLTAHETVDAEEAADKGAGPDEKIFVVLVSGALAGVRRGHIQRAEDEFAAVAVNLDDVVDGEIWIRHLGTIDGENRAVFEADFEIMRIDFQNGAAVVRLQMAVKIRIGGENSLTVDLDGSVHNLIITQLERKLRLNARLC